MDKMISQFKKQHTFAKRKAESDRVRQKYPGRIPIICEKVDKSDIVTLDKKKYLVPGDLTIGQFMYVIRKRVKLNPNKAIFVFIGGRLSSVVALMSSVDDQFKDEDGFLYIKYSGENTFG